MTPAILTVSVTERGRTIAAALPYPRSHGAFAATVRASWPVTDAFVLVVAVGAAVRVVGPLLKDKQTDPVVVCVDEAGRFVVPISGGHRHSRPGPSGNDLAREVAGLIGATPVITTATDSASSTSLDELAGLKAEGDVAAVTAALLDGHSVRIDNPLDWPLPLSLATARATEGAATGAPLAGTGAPEGRDPRVVVSDGVFGHGGATVVLRPHSLVAGIGSSSDAPPGEVAEAVAATMTAAGLAMASLHSVATIDRRAGEPGIAALGLPIRAFPPVELAAVEVPNPSAVVNEAVGTPSVAEAAALLAAGPGAVLVAQKRAFAHTTVAVARRARPEGHLAVVGLGPGETPSRTFEAVRAIRRAEVVIGFRRYIEQCADLLNASQTVIPSPIGEEVERARLAVGLANEGRSVVVVCSGDPGIYAMASLVLEEAAAAPSSYADAAARSSAAARLGSGTAPGTEVEIVPGVTAALAAAAALGAPLGHDHIVLSLSDLLTPWDLIRRRVEAARDADLVLALYNPRSHHRHWQLGAVRDILLERRRPETPAGVVTDVGRPGMTVSLATLASLDPELVGMTSCVIIGSSSTRLLGGRMVTPRGYPRC